MQTKIELQGNNHVINKHFSSELEAIVYLLNLCTYDERLGIFSIYCKYCGCNNPDCQCYNDE